MTASPEIVVAPFARGLGADLLIGTELKFDGRDRVTGAFDGPNCRGPEKVRRLRIGYLINMIHSVLATAEERLAKGEIDHADVPLLAANAMDMFAAALTAPLSAETIGFLSGQQAALDRQI